MRRSRDPGNRDVKHPFCQKQQGKRQQPKAAGYSQVTLTERWRRELRGLCIRLGVDAARQYGDRAPRAGHSLLHIFKHLRVSSCSRAASLARDDRGTAMFWLPVLPAPGILDP